VTTQLGQVKVFIDDIIWAWKKFKWQNLFSWKK